MEAKPKNLGRAYLVEKLRERGLSRRDSVRILNVILEEMANSPWLKSSFGAIQVWVQNV